MYNLITNVYSFTTASIQVNKKISDWFVCNSDVKHEGNCSPTLFSIFIDDLVQEVNNLGTGVNIDDTKLSMLLYEDDMILLA